MHGRHTPIQRQSEGNVPRENEHTHTHTLIQTVILGQSATMVLAASEGQAA